MAAALEAPMVALASMQVELAVRLAIWWLSPPACHPVLVAWRAR